MKWTTLTWSGCVDVLPFFPAPFDVVLVVGNGNSSLGTMSMRKSNWSDLLKAFAISDRDRVRRLLESAIMNARAVISEMNTNKLYILSRPYLIQMHRYALSQALQKRIGAKRRHLSRRKQSRTKGHTVSSNHLSE